MKPKLLLFPLLLYAPALTTLSAEGPALEGNMAYARYAWTHIEIDGVMDKLWSIADSYPVDNQNEDISCPWAPPEDFTARWRCL